MMAAPARSTTGSKSRVNSEKDFIAWDDIEMASLAPLEWQQIDTVLLDMDGTLLDLRFDNWFWQELIPRRYAAPKGLGEEEARGLLAPKFIEVKGTLQWYCIEYWTRELGLDIGSIK